MVGARKITIFDITNTVLLTLLAFTTFYPFLYTFNLSISTISEASKLNFHIVPPEFDNISLAAYLQVIKTPNIGTGYIISIYRTVVGTILTLFICSCYAFALSKAKLPYKKFFTLFLMFTMFFSGGMIPTYMLMDDLGLLNNILVYILPGAISAYNVVIMRSFFNSIPLSLTESAKIDGASEWVVYSRIIIPLSKSVLATVALWSSVGHWNAWFDSMLYIKDANKQVLQTFLRRVVIEGQTALINMAQTGEIAEFTPITIKMATIIVTILPILCVYPFIQKYFVSGVMLGSLKE